METLFRRANFRSIVDPSSACLKCGAFLTLLTTALGFYDGVRGFFVWFGFSFFFCFWLKSWGAEEVVE